MQLPENYIWIPGYEQRYAMKYQSYNGKLTIELDVYSFQYPGCSGLATKILSRNGYYKLSKNGYSESYYSDALRNRVRASSTFKEIESQHQTQLDKVVLPQPTSGATWIIASLHKTTLSMNPAPKQHETESSAYAEAERLATSNPGKTFVVFKAVRQVVVGGVTITDL